MSKEILRPQAKPAPAAQPEQEPVAWMDADGNVSDNNDHNCFPIPLYTTANIQSYLEKDNSQPEQKPVGLVPVPLAHIVGEIDHMGKVWTPAQPAYRAVKTVHEGKPVYVAQHDEDDDTQGFMSNWANFEEGRKFGRAEALERAWVDLTRQQFLDVTDDLEDLEDCWIQIQAKLKEVNIR